MDRRGAPEIARRRAEAGVHGGDCGPRRAQLAKTTLALAQAGLARRRRLDPTGHDESRYLQPIQDYAARGITPAEELLEKFHGPWDRSVDAVFKEYAY